MLVKRVQHKKGWKKKFLKKGFITKETDMQLLI